MLREGAKLLQGLMKERDGTIYSSEDLLERRQIHGLNVIETQADRQRPT